MDLIIYQDNLFALKRVPKKQIDKPKRIFHLKCEKNILMLLKQIDTEIRNGYFRGIKNFSFHSDDLIFKRESKDQVLHEQIFPLSSTEKQPSFKLEQNSSVEELSYHPLPLNYIVKLEETFSDTKNVNYIFEYLPGQDLYWVMNN